MSEHLARPPASAEALAEMSHVVEAVIGIPGNPTVGIACALVQVDPVSGDLKVSGSTWAVRTEDLDDVRKLVIRWLEAS